MAGPKRCTRWAHNSVRGSLQVEENTALGTGRLLVERISSTTLKRQSRYLRPKRLPIEVLCEAEFRRVLEARLAQHHHTHGRLIAGPSIEARTRGRPHID